MATEVINTVSLTKNPEFKNVKTINKNFRKIKKEHCNSLLDFLYNDGLGKWQNPFTKKFLRRESPIIISFLSRCYYMDDDSKINIQGCNLTYKKHIEKFINKEYLYVPSKKKSTNSNILNVNTQSVYGGGLRRSSRSSSRNKSTINAGSPFQFNTIGTWQPNLIQQPLAQSRIQSFKQPFAQSRVQSFEKPLSQPSYTYQQPYQQPQYTHTPTYQLPYHSTYPQLISANNVGIKRESQQNEDYYYESLNSGKRYYKREIPDDIWELIKKLGIYYLADVRGKFIDRMNEKYEKDKEILNKWEKEEPDKGIKKKKEYYKKEKIDKNYWITIGYRNFSSNALLIDDKKAYNKTYVTGSNQLELDDKNEYYKVHYNKTFNK